MLIVQFDGSLRRPRDITAALSDLTYLPSLAGPNAMATCAAAILRDDGEIVSLGGRYICTGPGVTSGSAEYDGLNLALWWLVNEAMEEETIWNDLWRNLGDGPPEVTVQGDCKTVIDHMNGAASPRRLRGGFETGKAYADRLEARLAREFGAACCPRVRFEHIPREDNVLCDVMCSAIGDLRLREAVGEARCAVASGQVLSSDPDAAFKPPRSAKKWSQFDKSHFSEACHRLSGSDGLLPYPSRMDLLQELLGVAVQTGDAVAVRMIGKGIKENAKRWPRMHGDDSFESDPEKNDCRNISFENRETLEALGTLLEAKGLEMVGLHFDANKLILKHKHGGHLLIRNMLEDGDGFVDMFMNRERGSLSSRESGDVFYDLLRNPIFSACAGPVNEWYTTCAHEFLLDEINNKNERTGSRLESGIWLRRAPN